MKQQTCNGQIQYNQKQAFYIAKEYGDRYTIAEHGYHWHIIQLPDDPGITD